MFRYTSNTGLVAALALLTAGCATLQVRTDSHPEVSFSQFRTYEWVNGDVDEGRHPAVNSPLVGARVQRAVDSTLADRGFLKTPTDRADFRIAYELVADEKTRVVRSSGYYGSYWYPVYFGGRTFWYRGFGYDRFGYYGFGPYADGRAYEYVEGTLVLDVFDAGTEELLWRGWASKSLGRDPNPRAVHKYVNEAVAEILARFPARPVAGPGLVAPDHQPPS